MANIANIGDRLLWIGIAIAGISAYWYIPAFLNDVKDLVAVSLPSPKAAQPQLQQDAEEAIKSRTLAELAIGSNYNLSAAAIRLTATRFIEDRRARGALLSDLASQEWHRRDQALNGLRLLLTFPATKDLNLRQHFIKLDTYTALVTALINILPQHERGEKDLVYTSPIRSPNRPVHEQIILEILLILLDNSNRWDSSDSHVQSVRTAIDAGIITKWLKHYPFPCTLPVNNDYNFKRSDVSTLLEEDVWGTDDMPMAKLFRILRSVSSGARQLEGVGLKAVSMFDRTTIGSREWATRSHPTLTFEDYQPVSDWRFVSDSEGDEPADDRGQLIEDEELLGRLGEPRSREWSEMTAGERSRQRRHRQAVVVAEAGVPLRPENILQPQPTETELAWHQEVRERQGQILRPIHDRTSSAEELAVDQLARERIDGLADDGISFPSFRLPDLDALSVNQVRNESSRENPIVGEENTLPEDLPS